MFIGGNDRYGGGQGRFSSNDNDNYARKRNASEMADSITNNNKRDNWEDNNGTKRTRFSDQHQSNNNYGHRQSSSLAPAAASNINYEGQRSLFSNVSNFNRSNNFH